MRLIVSLGKSAAGAYQVLKSLDALERQGHALSGRERELTDFFENAGIGLHWVGPDGTILRANQAELDMLGYPARSTSAATSPSSTPIGR